MDINNDIFRPSLHKIALIWSWRVQAVGKLESNLLARKYSNHRVRVRLVRAVCFLTPTAAVGPRVIDALF